MDKQYDDMMTVPVGDDDYARFRILMTRQKETEHIGTDNQRYLT